MAYLIGESKRNSKEGKPVLIRKKKVSKSKLRELIVKAIRQLTYDLAKNKMSLSCLVGNISCLLMNENSVHATNNEIFEALNIISYWRDDNWDKRKKKRPDNTPPITEQFPAIRIWM